MISRKKKKDIFFSTFPFDHKGTQNQIIYLENLLQADVCFVFPLFLLRVGGLKAKRIVIGNRLQLVTLLEMGINGKPGWEEWKVWWQNNPGLVWHFHICRIVLLYIMLGLISIIFRGSVIISKPCGLYINASKYFIPCLFHLSPFLIVQARHVSLY